MADTTAISISQGKSTGESHGESQGQSSSTPENMLSAQSEWGLQLSQLLSALGQHQYNWAMDQYNHGQDVTNQNINKSLALSGMGTDLAKELITQYKDLFEPAMQAFHDQTASYNSEERQRFMMGQAESTVGQAEDAARDAAERQLTGLGVNVNSGRYQDLLLSSQLKGAAAAAGAGTQAALDTADRGRQMLQAEAQMGQNVPGMTVNSLQAGLAGVGQAQNALLGQENAGVQLTSSAAPFYNAGVASNKLPPVGNVQQATNQSKQESQNQSQQGSVSVSRSPSRPSGDSQEKQPQEREQPQQRQQAGRGLPGTGAGGGPQETRNPYGEDPGTGEQVNPNFGTDYPVESWDDIRNPALSPGPLAPDMTLESAPWAPAGQQSLPQGFNAGTSNPPAGSLYDQNMQGRDAPSNMNAVPLPSYNQSDNGQLPEGAQHVMGQINPQDFGFNQGTQQFNQDPWGGQQFNQPDFGQQQFDQGFDRGYDPWSGFQQDQPDYQQQFDQGFDQGYDPFQDYQQQDPFQQEAQQFYNEPDYGQQDQSQEYDQQDYSPPDYQESYDYPPEEDYGGEEYARGGPVRAQRGVLPTTGGPVPRSASPSRGRQTDDIPARLNAGEFVIPRDVTSHYGTKHFQDLIKKSRQMRTGMAGPPAQPKMKPSLRLRPTFTSRGM